MMTDSNIDDATVERMFAAARRAISATVAGRSHQEVCPVCAGALQVIGYPAGGPFSAFDVRCPCGKSNGRFKGF